MLSLYGLVAGVTWGFVHDTTRFVDSSCLFVQYGFHVHDNQLYEHSRTK